MHPIRRINYIEAKEILRQQGYLIDVRSAEEYRQFHLPGSISMPLEEIYDEYEKYLPDKSIPVIVYCATGTRSRIATVFFHDLGYQRIFDLGGLCRR